ncbi:MAG: hypothetical protein H6736_15815 [Alphaproteobacteria bacterium]|nr:hypothetical protein [Alphaproteobacteria bacterium]MCB9693278.1 hypothetical protein [Alphaproteobacteria bacterium]
MIALLTAALAAPQVEGEIDYATQLRSTWRSLPSTRFEMRGVSRPGKVLGSMFAVYLQAARYQHLSLDVGIGGQPGSALAVRGVLRRHGAVEGSVDLWLQVVPTLSLGATAGTSAHLYYQQFWFMQANAIPFVGGRVQADLIRARKWSVGLTGRVTCDLIPTDLYIEDAEIVRLAPVEVQVGVRAQFGRAKEGEP